MGNLQQGGFRKPITESGLWVICGVSTEGFPLDWMPSESVCVCVIL